MVQDYRRDDGARLIVVVLTGTVSRADVRALLDRQATDGTWAHAVVYDERGARAELSADDLRALAAQAAELSKKHGPRGRVAIVVGVDVDYGVNRMASAYADLAGYKIAVFRSYDAAVTWAVGQGPINEPG